MPKSVIQGLMQRVGKYYCMGEYPPPSSGLLPGFADEPEGVYLKRVNDAGHYHVQSTVYSVLPITYFSFTL